MMGLGVSMPMPAGVGVATGGGGGGFSPLDLSPTLWLDASDTSTITESTPGSGAVSQWDDKSGNGYNLVQATSSAQPKTGTATINSLNVLEFDGASTQYMNETAAVLSSSHTLFAVYEWNSSDTEFMLVTGQRVDTWAYPADDNGTSTNMFGVRTTEYGLYIDATEWTGTTRAQLWAAIPKNSASLTRATFTFVFPGWGAGYPGSPWAPGSGSKIAEMILVASPTAQQISDTETYLANKWGITL